MGLTKRWLHELEEQKSALVEQLAEQSIEQSEQIELMFKKIQEANSFKSKAKDWFAGVVVGALVGYFFSCLL